MSARDEILAALRRASVEAPLPAPLEGAAFERLLARFVERAVDVGTEVHVVGADTLPNAIVRAVTATGGGTVILWQDPLLDGPAEALRAAGIEVISGGAETRDAAAAAAAGLTSVDYAIAETGTLVLAGAPGRSRAASLLPARHLAVLPETRIRRDLFALMQEIRSPLPSSLTFITGPSRTADVGLTLVRPAHGPLSVSVFIITGGSL